MKLPYFLVLLAAFSQAAAGSKTSESQTSKRELVEGNQGDQHHKRELEEGNHAEQNQRRQVLSKHATSTGMEYAEGLKEEIPELSPGPVFGARWPQISKISDLLSGAGTPFEVAVANHLHSPVSVYQNRLPPAPFEVANHQLIPLQIPRTFSNLKPRSKPIEPSEEEVHNLQNYPASLENQDAHFQNLDADVVADLKHMFNAASDYRQHIEQGFQRLEQKSALNELPPYYPTRQPFFQIYENPGALQHAGQFLPTRYLEQQSIAQLVPVQPNPKYQEEEQKNSQSVSQEQHKPEPLVPNLSETAGFGPTQGYHAHPNGAISFARFTHNLPTIDLTPTNQRPNDLGDQYYQSQPIIHQRQQKQLIPGFSDPSEHQARHREAQYQPIPVEYLQHSQNYQLENPRGFFSIQMPDLGAHPQVNVFPTQYSPQPRPKQINSLQKQLIISSLQSLQNLQNVPPFKPLPPTNTLAPVRQDYIPSSNPSEANKFHFISLSTNHNSKRVSSLPDAAADSHSEKSLVHGKKGYASDSPSNFLPTTSQPSFKTDSAPDQLVLSTTVHPDIVNHPEEIKVQPLEQEPSETQNHDPSSPPLTVQPIIRSATLTKDIDSHQQPSTPQPQLSPSPRHEVVIQQQELQEYHSQLKPQPLFYQQRESQTNSPQHHQHLEVQRVPQQQQFGNKILPENQQRIQQDLAHEKQYEEQKSANSQDIVDKNSPAHQKLERENSHSHDVPKEPSPQANQDDLQPDSEQDNKHSLQLPSNVQYDVESQENPDQNQGQKDFELKFVPVVSTEEPFLDQPLPFHSVIPQFSLEPQSSLVHPVYPSEVQYFGRYAPSIFGDYQR